MRRCVRACLVVLALLSAGPAAAQYERGGERAGGGGGERGAAGRPAPQTTVATRVDSTGAETPVVRVSVPYRSLVFLRRGEDYASGVRVTVIATRKGHRVGGGVGTADVTVPDFRSTHAEGQLACSLPLAIQGTGEVDLAVTIAVKETARSWQEQLTYKSGAGLNIPLYFADFHWNLEGVAGGAGALGVDRDTVRAAVDLGRRPNVTTWPAGGVTLVAQVRSVPTPGNKKKAASAVAAEQRVPIPDVPARAPVPPVHVAWAASALPFGRLELAMRIESGGGANPEKLEFEPPRAFVNLAQRYDADKDWQQQVDWLEGFITKDQEHALLAVPAAQRSAVWRELWAKTAVESGASATELERTHLLRIVEADERFGNSQRGALTDRGRVLIRYGQPDSVERRGDEMGYEGRWEIWYYNNDRLVFTFYDAHGMGDFRLVGQSTL